MNFGIIGLGNIANKFAKTLNELNESLYAVASRDINKAKDFATTYNAKKYYGSYKELFNDPSVDVIYISTPNNMHYINAKDALYSGKHVICEKPFTTNPDEAKELYEIAKKCNLFIMEALWIEFLPMYKKLKELLKANYIGKIESISVSYGFDTNPTRKIRKFDSNLAGGALLDIGIYNLGLLDMLTDSEVKDFTSTYKLNEYNTDEYSKINLVYKNGIKATSITSIGQDIKREVFIKGTNGEIYIPDFQHAEKFIVKNDKEEEYNFPFEINGFEYQIKELIECIKEKKNESITYPASRSIRLMKLLYDIRMSWNMKFLFEE